jgi:FkbH-like protein
LENIKLIIWDLDDTIWNGSLGEDGFCEITPFSNIISLFRENCKKGVMNSVCSLSNKEDDMIRKLKELGIYEYIVFPSINTFPKGERVRDIVLNMQLRNQNVLFVDDLESNLEEVKTSCEGIHTINSKSKELIGVIEDNFNASKGDSDMERLARYRILEKKNELKKQYDGDKSFLFDSNVIISFKESPMKHKERIGELINRSNQLNFTKKMVDEKEEFVKDNSFAISVRDKYGDYGICGYISFENDAVEHFVFSCRVLNMGIETFCYHHLKCHAFNIIGEVSGEIGNEKPDWIGVEKFNDVEIENNIKNVLMIGGCDLEQIYPFMDKKGDAQCIFPSISPKAKLFPNKRDSLDLLLSSKLSKEQVKYVMDTTPFFDGKCFDMPSFRNYKTIIWSPLTDYINHTYISKGIEMSIDPRVTDIKSQEDKINYEHATGISVAMQTLFLEKWERKENDYGKKIKQFLRLTESVRCVLIVLGVTNAYSNLNKEWCEEYKKLNEITMNAAEKHRNVFCVDVNKFIKSRSDFVDSIRHYKKHVYLEIAKEVNEIMNGEL